MKILHSSSVLTVCINIFGQKEIGLKALRTMLVKLTFSIQIIRSFARHIKKMLLTAADPWAKSPSARIRTNGFFNLRIILNSSGKYSLVTYNLKENIWRKFRKGFVHLIIPVNFFIHWPLTSITLIMDETRTFTSNVWVWR